MIWIKRLDDDSKRLRDAKRAVEQNHYLHRMPDPRTSYEVYGFGTGNTDMGYMVFGRPEATRCGDWYGGLDDVQAGRCEVTRWQVLNLARVWIYPEYQTGGARCVAGVVPGYTDRRGVWRSTLASEALRVTCAEIGVMYLIRRPPCFLDEPYEIKWLLSYCDTRLHRGTIYAAAGFERYRVNNQGIETWRIRLPEFTARDDDFVRAASINNQRAIRYRAQRAQLEMQLKMRGVLA